MVKYKQFYKYNEIIKYYYYVEGNISSEPGIIEVNLSKQDINIITPAPNDSLQSFSPEDARMILDGINENGLPSNKAINIFELGFCDRCLAQELVSFVNEENDKDLIRFDLLKSKDDVLQILKEYPSYFESVFDGLNY